MATTKSPDGALPFRRLLLAGVLVGLALVMFGWALVPAANPLSVAAASLIIIIYGLAFYFITSRADPKILKWAGRFGLAAGAVFTAEILLEYILLPKDNTAWGLIEFGLVFFIYLLSALWAAHNTGKNRAATLTALLTAMVSSLIWVIVVLSVFYFFRGTERQMQVLIAEGDYADFLHTGASDFNTWIMEDFFGAVFFHSLLMPLVTPVLGAIGTAVGTIRLKRAGKSVDA